MKKNIFIFCVLFLCAILQVSGLSFIFPNKSVPQIIPIIIFAGVVVFGFSETWKWAIVAGILIDIFTYSRLGVHVIMFILFTYLGGFISRRFLLESKILGIITMTLIIIIITFVEMLFSFKEFFNFQKFINYMFKNSLEIVFLVFFNLGLFFLCFYFFKKIKKNFYSQEYKFN